MGASPFFIIIIKTVLLLIINYLNFTAGPGGSRCDDCGGWQNDSDGESKRVKTYLRATTVEDRLSSLCLMSIFRDLPIDLEEIIDLFAAEKSRKMNFIHPTVRAETKNTPDMY